MTTLAINGTLHETRDGNRTLLDLLRDDLDLKGAKLACGEGRCGACTVLLDGKPICACLQLVSSADGRDIRTVEFVAGTDVGRRVVDALVGAGAVQCGFCTPGIVVAAAGEISMGLPNGLDGALEGNLCRCTGYAKIRRALETVSTEGEPCGRVARPGRASLSSALDRLAADPDLVPIAGGTDLLVRNEHRLSERRFLDLNDIGEPSLASIRKGRDEIVIGALVTWSDLLRDADVAQHLPMLSQAARTVGSEQIRNVATLAGNLVAASSTSDGIVVLSALGAELEISHRAYRRRVTLADFVTGPGRSALLPGELVTAISIPVPSDGRRTRHFFRKVGPRRAQAVSRISLGVVATFDGDVVQDLRMCFGAVGPKPTTCPATTRHLIGKVIDEACLDGVRHLLGEEMEPADDCHATATYRREVAWRLLAAALRQVARPAVLSG